MDRRGLVLEPVAGAVEVAVPVRVERLHRPLPGPDLFREHAQDAGRGMEMQVAADVLVPEAGTAEQDGRLQGAAGERDGARTDSHNFA